MGSEGALEAAERAVRRTAERLVSACRRIIHADSPPRADGDDWGIWRWFFVAFAVIAAGIIFMGRSYYFGTPFYEIGDLAANSLQIDRAAHLQEALGNYSRFGFHHPGPAFFYVYAAGEVLFYNVLHLVPAQENGHMLAGALLQSAFLAAALAILARFASPNRGLFVVAALAIAAVHFQLAGNPEYSLWPPEQLVIPFGCFVVVAVAVACGRMGLLPLLVLCGGFLVHGHVAQPLYVLPIAAIAIAVGTWRSIRQARLTLRGFIRANRKPFLVTFALLAVFVAPLLRDATQPGSNLNSILTYLTKPRVNADVHSPKQIVEYVLAFLGYPMDVAVLDTTSNHLGAFMAGHWAGFAVSLAVLVALPLALLVAHLIHPGRVDSGTAMAATADSGNASDVVAISNSGRSDRTPIYATYYVFLALVAALTLIWVGIQKGPLYQFNSYFVYGLMFVAAMPPLLALCRRWPLRWTRLTTALVGVLAVGVMVTASIPVPLGEFPDGVNLNHSVRALLAARTSNEPVLLNWATDDDWGEAAGIALVLLRSDVPWFVGPQWGFKFGAAHVYYPGSTAPTPETWVLTTPDATHVDQIVLHPRIAIYPTPPSLSGHPQAP